MDAFHNDRSKADGKYPRCKDCERERGIRRRAANPGHEAARTRRWRDENPDKVQAWYDKTRDRMNALARERYARMPKPSRKPKQTDEEYRMKQKEYYLRNKESKRDYQIHYYRKNKGKVYEINRNSARKAIKNISIRYVKIRLKRKGFASEHLEQYPELIEVQRQLIKNKRLCETLEN